MEKKATTKFEGTKAAVKEAEKKVAAKVEEAKATAEKAVTETKVDAEKAVAETKTTAEKAVADTKKAVKEKKVTRVAKKAEKEVLKPEVFVQFQGREVVVEEVVEKAKAQYVAEGHRVSSIKSLQVYLKPEEYAAYYVINQKFAGRVDLF